MRRGALLLTSVNLSSWAHLMPRQPFPKRYHAGPWLLEPDSLSDRLDHASIIGRCIGLWSSVELQMALLLSILLKAENTEATVSVYQVLRRFTPRYQALEAAGAATLSDKDKELLDAVLFMCVELQGQRNALAHGSWGASSQAPNSILWCEPSDMAQHAIGTLRRETVTGKRPPSDEIADALVRKVYHYTVKDLESLHKQIKQLQKTVFNFCVYLRSPSKPTWNVTPREEQYDRLRNLARIRSALRALHARAAKNKKPQ